MASATNINDVLEGYVTLEIDCVDRMLFNAYVPALQVPRQVVRSCAATWVIRSPAGVARTDQRSP